MTAWTNLPLLGRSLFRNNHLSTAAAAATDTLISRFASILKHFSRSNYPKTRPRSRTRPVNPVDTRTYNQCLISSSLAGEPDEVLGLLNEMKMLPTCRPDVLSYTIAINSLLNSNRHRDAEKLFDEMIQRGIRPDTISWTSLVKLFHHNMTRFDIAHEIIGRIREAGCDPDVFTYSALVSGFCKNGKIDLAWKVMHEMFDAGCMPNVQTYTPILQAYCSNKWTMVAKKMVDWMRSNGCSPDVVANNILIHGLCTMRKFDDVENVINRSEMDGWKPDVVTYNTYINGLCKVGKAEEALRQLEVMLEKGLRPNKVTLCILLDCLCRQSDVWAVKNLLEMNNELKFDVDVENYNAVMSRLGEMGEGRAVLMLFTNIFKKGFVPNTHTFNIVINSLCKAGMLAEAISIFRSRGFVPDIVSYNILIHAFSVAGKSVEIRYLFSEVDEKNIARDVVTYNTLIDHLCKQRNFFEAIRFVKCQEDDILPNLIPHLIFGLVLGGKLGEMLRLFEELIGRGLVLDACIFNSLITAFCRKGSCQSKDMPRVCLFLDRMLGLT